MKETALDIENELCFEAIDKIIETKKALQIKLDSLEKEMDDLTYEEELYYSTASNELYRSTVEKFGFDKVEVNDDEINDFEVDDDEFNDR